MQSSKNQLDSHSYDPKELEGSLEITSKTEAMINGGYRGKSLPDTAEDNPVEMEIHRHAADCNKKLSSDAMQTIGTVMESIDATDIDENQVSQIEERFGVHVNQITREQLTEYQTAKQELNNKRSELEAFRATYGIYRDARIGDKARILWLTIWLLLSEGMINAISLFSSGVLPGGFLGAVTISLFVGIVNTFWGYLIGEHLWADTKPINTSSTFVRFRAMLLIALLIVAALTINIGFSLLRASGGDGMIHFLIQNPLNFTVLGFSSFGMTIVFWIARKWWLAGDENKALDRMVRGILIHKAEMEQKYEQIRDMFLFIGEAASNELNEFLQQEGNDLNMAAHGLKECSRVQAALMIEQERIKEAHETVIEYHRSAICRSGIPNTPAYFRKQADLFEVIINPINLDGLVAHMKRLELKFEQLKTEGSEAKKRIQVVVDRALGRLTGDFEKSMLIEHSQPEES